MGSLEVSSSAQPLNTEVSRPQPLLPSPSSLITASPSSPWAMPSALLSCALSPRSWVPLLMALVPLLAGMVLVNLLYVSSLLPLLSSFFSSLFPTSSPFLLSYTLVGARDQDCPRTRRAVCPHRQEEPPLSLPPLCCNIVTCPWKIPHVCLR